ncbi:MAG: GNAT family N-acetyltransferase [Ideonella sp.]|jgi:ribosomal protein S18 acetylase RimI-like enzyme|nr:GNAT family N-acetyltransferase [Ideonella sp.]
MTPITIEVHDTTASADAAQVDEGIGRFNDEAAPLHEVQSLACYARSGEGVLVGGAVGRLWGPACELLQLWVASEHRRCGHGRALMQAFEHAAAARGARSVHLETFSFQSPDFYRRLGYEPRYERRDFPHGIVKWHLLKRLEPDVTTEAEPGWAEP